MTRLKIEMEVRTHNVGTRADQHARNELAATLRRIADHVQIGGNDVELDHGMLKLLVPDGAVIDDWDLRRLGRGRVKDAEGRDAAGGRRIVLTGQLRHGEIRVHRGGIAILSAMFSRAFVEDLRQARKDGTYPTVDDPTRTIR